MKEIIKVIECELLPSHYRLSCYLIFPKADDAIDKDFLLIYAVLTIQATGKPLLCFYNFLRKVPNPFVCNSHHMASETQIIVLLKELSGHS